MLVFAAGDIQINVRHAFIRSVGFAPVTPASTYVGISIQLMRESALGASRPTPKRSELSGSGSDTKLRRP